LKSGGSILQKNIAKKEKSHGGKGLKKWPGKLSWTKVLPKGFHARGETPIWIKRKEVLMRLSKNPEKSTTGLCHDEGLHDKGGTGKDAWGDRKGGRGGRDFFVKTENKCWGLRFHC